MHKFFPQIRILMSFLTLAVTALGSYARADVDAWSAVSLYGGVVQALVVEPGNPSVIYAGTQLSGVYKSLDGGASWTAVNGGLTKLNVLSLAINPVLPTTLYAGTAGGGVFRSVDGGTNWNPINSGTAAVGVDLASAIVNALRLDPNDPNTMYAATFGGVFKTTNQGELWDVTGPLRDNGIFDLAVNRADSNVIFIATQSGGVYRSVNAGTNWSLCNGPADAALGSKNIRALALTADGATLFAASQGSGVFMVQGASANDCNLAATNPIRWLGTGTLPERNVRVLVLQGTQLIAGTAGGSYVSEIGSNNWVGPNIALAHVNAFAADSANTSTFFAGTAQGVLKSVDKGITWTAQSTGMRSLDITDIALHPSNPAIRFAATRHSGIARSLDGGNTWSFVNTGIADLQVLSVALAGASPAVYLGTANLGLFKSDDNGATWSNLQSNLGALSIADLLIDRVTETTVYAATPSGVAMSADAGATWTLSAMTQRATPIVGLLQDPTTPEVLYANSNEAGVFKSIDNGKSWTRSSAGLTVLAVQSLAMLESQPNVLFAATHGGGIFRSENAGTTWTPKNTGLSTLHIQSLISVPASSSVLYAATLDAGVFKSSDGGSSWFSLDTGLISPAATKLVIDMTTSPSTVYTGTAGSGLMAIQSTVERSTPATPNNTPPIVSGNNDGGGLVWEWIVVLCFMGFIRRLDKMPAKNSRSQHAS